MDMSGATWRKSTHSGGNNDCVELADLGPILAVRDSKNPDGPKLAFGSAAAVAFLSAIKKA